MGRQYSVVIISVVFILFFAVTGQQVALSWTYTADFEAGTVGAPAEGDSGLSNANENGSTKNLYSDTRAHLGNQSMRNYFVSGDTGSPGSTNATGGSIGYTSTISTGGEIWGRMYLWIPDGTGWNWTCDPFVKVFRLAHVYQAGGAHRGYISIFGDTDGNMVLSNELDGQSNHERSAAVTYTRGEWQSIEIYIKFSPTAGIVRIWKNGVLAREETNYRTLAADTDYASGSLIWTYWNGGHPQDQYAWVDDIIITTDTPSGRDAAGNPMIGPHGWGGVVGGRLSGSLFGGGVMR